jgi:hypothetical protein
MCILATSTLPLSAEICVLRPLKVKLTLHKALIRPIMTYASPAWEFAADTRLLPAKQDSPYHWQFS